MQITQKLRHPGVASLAVLVAMLLVSVGSWGVQHVQHGHFTWGEFLAPLHVFSLLGVLGSVLGAWLAKSPLSEAHARDTVKTPSESKAH